MGFASYSMIAAEAGEMRRVEDFQAGDRVIEGLTGTPLMVVNCRNSPGIGMVRVHFGDGDVLDVTGDQNLLTDSGMIAANRLTPGVGLRGGEDFIECTGMEALMGDYMVYDLELEECPLETPWLLVNGLVAAAAK